MGSWDILCLPLDRVLALSSPFVFAVPIPTCHIVVKTENSLLCICVCFLLYPKLPHHHSPIPLLVLQNSPETSVPFRGSCSGLLRYKTFWRFLCHNIYLTVEIVYWTFELNSKFLESRNQVVFTHMCPYPWCLPQCRWFQSCINVFKNRKEGEGKEERRKGKGGKESFRLVLPLVLHACRVCIKRAASLSNHGECRGNK